MAISVMEPLIASFKSNLGVAREATVADRLGVARTALANYRKGIRRMPDAAMAKLADGLNVPLGDVVASMNISLMDTPQDERDLWLDRISDENVRRLAETFGGWKKFGTRQSVEKMTSVYGCKAHLPRRSKRCMWSRMHATLIPSMSANTACVYQPLRQAATA